MLLFTLCSCNSNNGKIKIIGEIKGYADSTKVIMNNFGAQAQVDTTYIINHKFRFTASSSVPTPYGIFIGNGNEREFLFFFKENVDISINGNKGSIKYASIDGGEIQGQCNSLNKITRQLNKRFDDVNAELRKAYKGNDMEKAKSLEKQIDNIIHERIVLGATYVKENPDNLISAFALEGYIPGLPKSEIKSLYENLSPKIKESDYAKSVFKFLELSKEVKIGDIAEDFQLPDLNGNVIGLKGFKGKYVLLEFWEAGCKGCRIENKNLLAQYKLYKDKGFEIISVTADRNKNNWESAVRQDSIIWISLQDLNPKDGRVGTRYNVKLIPSNFLIDPNGRIIAMNLRDKELREKLKEIF
jgi:peroxiredoxin